MRTSFQIALQSGIPTLFRGEPGVGKSSGISAFWQALGEPVEVVIASIREPSDFSGLPFNTEHGVILEPPAWAKRLHKAGRGALFFDEISAATPTNQNALMRIVLDRWVGDLKLPDAVKVAAACNPLDQSAGGWDLTAPLANRFCHLRWQLDPKAWVVGMTSGWPAPEIIKLPDNWHQAHYPASAALVAAYINHAPHHLLQVPKDESRMGEAWPSPRSWTGAATLHAACGSVRETGGAMAELIAGCVGEGAAVAFLNWVEQLDLPDPEEVLRDPTGYELPKRGDRLYAALTSVVAAVVSNNTPERWVAGCDVMAHAYEKGLADVAAQAAALLVKVRPPKTRLPQSFGKLLSIFEVVDKK